MSDEKLVPIQFFVTEKFRRLIKEEAARRGKTVKETCVLLLKAWAKIKEA